MLRNLTRLVDTLVSSPPEMAEASLAKLHVRYRENGIACASMSSLPRANDACEVVPTARAQEISSATTTVAGHDRLAMMSATVCGCDRNGWWPAFTSITSFARRENSRCAAAGVPRSSVHTT